MDADKFNEAMDAIISAGEALSGAAKAYKARFADTEDAGMRQFFKDVTAAMHNLGRRAPRLAVDVLEHEVLPELRAAKK
jgi:hypothetical protein